ncbi:MAG: hypothetical protein K0Q72_2642 [Armatimonadetes bacterium]|nr:hypothetical protein [Armatimonadota bacterium]
MSQFEKYYTVEEANSLLPELRTLLEKIQTARDEILAHYQEALPVLKLVSQNSGGKEAAAYAVAIWKLNSRVRKLVSLGVQLKDLDRGLVDFPAWRDDQEVLLCWHLGEDEVSHWHDLESGFAGRQAL